MAALMSTAMLLTLVAWSAISAGVILDRCAHDLRQRWVRRAARRLDSPRLRQLPRAERAAAIARLLRHLPPRTVYRVAADSGVPPFLAEAFASFAVARWGSARLRRDAAASGRRRRWRRVAALRVLAWARDPHLVPLLKRALNGGDATVAGAAAALLARVPQRRAAELLVGALRDGSCPGSRIATALESSPVSVADLLLPLLSAPAPATRLWAATLLARYPGYPGLDRALAALTRDPDASVRRAAVESLGRIGGPAAAEAALRLLGDAAWYVQAHAARAIGELRRVDLAARVTPLLAHEQWWVRLAARETLEALGPAAWGEVAACLAHADRFAREGAAEVLHNLGLGAGEPPELVAAPVAARAAAPAARALPVARLEEVCS